MKKNFTRALSVVLALAMILCCIPFASASSSEITGNDTSSYQVSNPSFATMSDLHVYTEDLVKNGSKDYKKQSDNSTMLGESFPVLNAAFETVEKSVKDRGLRYVFITGDLTSHGEKPAHIRLAQFLRSFQNKMRKEYDPDFHIFVVPGNHDVNYYTEAKYFDENGKVVFGTASKEAADYLGTTSEDFAYIYRELGYGAEDTLADKINYYKQDIGLNTFTEENPCSFDDAYANLSYSVELKDAHGQDIKLVAIDGCIYSSDVTSKFVTIDGKEYAHQETGCTIDDNHLNWAVSQSAEGKSKDQVVIGITHFAVVPHFTIQAAVIKMFIYPNWQSMATKLADAGMNYIYSGHVHSSDVTAYTTDSGNTLYDIETPSMGNYSNSYRENSVSKSGEKIKFKTVLRSCDADSQVDMSRVWYDYDENGNPNYIATKYNVDINGNPYKKISKPFSDNYGVYLFLSQKPLADSKGDTIVTDENGDLIKPDALKFATNTVNGVINGSAITDIIEAGGCLAYIENLLGSSLTQLLDKYFGEGESITLSVITVKKSDVVKLAELICKEIDESYIGTMKDGVPVKNTKKLVAAVDELIAKLLDYNIGGYTLNEIATHCLISMYQGTEGQASKWSDVDMSKVYEALNDTSDSPIRGLMDFLIDNLLGYTTTDKDGKEVKVDGTLVDLLDDLNISIDMINSILPDFAGILRYPALRKLILGSASTTPSIIDTVNTWAGRIFKTPYEYQRFATGETQKKSVTDTASLAEYFIFNLASDYLTSDQIHMVSLLIDSSISSFAQDPLFTNKDELQGTYPFIDSYDLKSHGLVSGYDNAATIDYQPLAPKSPADSWYQLPTSISVTFGTDPATTKNINWITNENISGTDVQVIPYKANATASDFESANLVGSSISADKTVETIGMTYPTMDAGVYVMGETTLMNRHTVELTGLSANTKYSYRIGDASKNIWADSASITTSAGDNSAYTFLYMTDSQSQSKEQYDSTYGNLLANAFDKFSDSKFILHTGDMVDYGANMLQWQWALGQNGLTDTTIASTAGNHEPKGTNGKDGMLTTAFGPSQDTMFDIEHTEQDVSDGIYYDFNYNDSHIMVLNTNNLSENKTLSQDQLDWLTKSVASSDKTWQIVSMHKSIYSNASHYDDTDVVALRKQLSKLMPELGIDVVFSGHDHVFVRTEFMNNGKVTGTFDESGVANSQSGTVYLINGKSGIKDYTLKTDSAVNSMFDLESMKTVGVTGRDTYSAVTIDGSSLSVKTMMLSVDGKSSSQIDSFTINKTKLATPKKLTTKASSTTSIKLSWGAVSGCNAYQVYRADSLNGSYTKIATVSGTSYNDANCKTNATYYYKVVAGTNKLKSDASEAVSGMATIPAVSNLRATKKTNTSIQATWSKLAVAKSYRVYVSLSKTSGYTLAGTVTKPNFVISSLTKGKTYYVKVSAFDGTAYGEYTVPVEVKM